MSECASPEVSPAPQIFACAASRVYHLRDVRRQSALGRLAIRNSID